MEWKLQAWLSRIKDAMKTTGRPGRPASHATLEELTPLT